MADYDDKSYYEIQLEQKQLVLILVLMVAICVLFFFLGVYYVKGREPLQAANARATPSPAATPATPGSGEPEKVDAEAVSRFFEPNEGKGAAPKEEFEGKVIAESLPGDVPARPEKGERKASKESKESKEKETPAPTRTAAAPPSEPTRVAPPPERPPADEPRSAGAGFVVQIAAMKDEDRAQKVMGELKALGYPAYIKTEQGAPAPFKIRVGPFTEREKAVAAKDVLVTKGHPGAFVSSD